MSKSKSLPTTAVGIDVAKESVDVCFLDQNETENYSGSYPEDAYKSLVKKIAKAKPNIIILEATGGYERVIVALLAAAALPYRIVSPNRARHFAQAIGELGKNDRIDARMLALYGLRNKIEPITPPTENTLKLKALLKRRRQLLSIKTAEQVRAQLTEHKIASKSIETILNTITAELQTIDAELDKVIIDDDDFRQKEEIITSVPGVSTQTARTLLGDLPELGSMTRNEAAALVGLAPFARDSGKKSGKRFIRGGRVNVRNALYMPTVSAIQHNPAIKTVYQRLLGTGKPKMVALTACMRKLLLLLNALLKKNELFAQ